MGTPLTAFLIALLKAKDERRDMSRADPVKLAERHGVSVEHVRGYLRMLG